MPMLLSMRTKVTFNRSAEDFLKLSGYEEGADFHFYDRAFDSDNCKSGTFLK